MKKEDLRLLVAYGEGYYSGASRQWALAFDIKDLEFLKENCEIFKDDYIPYFGELDGKHSEVEGDISIENDFEYIIKTFEDSDEDYFTEEIHYDYKKDTEVYKKLKVAYDFIKQFHTKNVYKHKITGEEIELSDYEKVLKVCENE